MLKTNVLKWLSQQKNNYARKVQREGKEYIDKNVDELRMKIFVNNGQEKADLK